MKKALMSFLFSAVAAVLFAGQGFAQDYYGVFVDTANYAGGDINASQQVSVIDNVFQPGGSSSQTIAATWGGGLYGSLIFITTGSLAIGNINASGNSVKIDRFTADAGQIHALNIYLDNIASVGNITADSNKVEISSMAGGFDVYAARVSIAGPLSSSFKINSSKNEISITGSQTGDISASDISISSWSLANITSDNNKITVLDSEIGRVCGVGINSKSDVRDLINFTKNQANNNSILISNSLSYDRTTEAVYIDGDNITATGNSVTILNSPEFYFYEVYGVEGYAALSGKLNNNSVFIKIAHKITNRTISKINPRRVVKSKAINDIIVISNAKYS